MQKTHGDGQFQKFTYLILRFYSNRKNLMIAKYSCFTVLALATLDIRMYVPSISVAEIVLCAVMQEYRAI